MQRRCYSGKIFNAKFTITVIQTVERYDPVREEWSMVASMNKRRCGVGVAVLGMITVITIS